MRTALTILLLCAAVDLLACGLLLVVVWVEHRRVRQEAAGAGQPIPSAAGEFGCLIACGLLGFLVVYGSAWILLRE